MERFDLIIIGGGAAAFAAAAKASELGVTVAMINSGLPIGGTCVNVGCVPTKLFLEMGSDYYYRQHPRFEVAGHERSPTFDFEAAMREKDDTVRVLRKSNYSEVLAAMPTVTFYEGQASFTAEKQVRFNDQALEAEKFIIATGSSPKVLPIAGIDKVDYLTHIQALQLDRLPESMAIVGGRAQALEFAQMFARFGSKVTVLQRSSRIVPNEEPEISDALREYLEAEGIEIHTGVSLQKFEKEGEYKIVTAQVGQRMSQFKAQQLLMAGGRDPNTGGLGLEKIGVQVNGSGAIVVDGELRTTAAHIWAAGDVIGEPMLETVAAKEGSIAASNALQGTKKTIDYESVPKAIFTDPQVASVGLTEAEYMRRYNVCSCRTIEIAQVPKARAIKETRGLVKMTIHPETQVVAGVHMVAPMAADLIHEAVLAVKFKLTIDDIIDTVHVFPTMSEAIKLVAQSFKRDISKMSCCVE